MTDLLTACQDAVFAAVHDGMPDGLSVVLQHVPEDAKPPLTIIGNITAQNIGGKDDPLEQHTIEVVSFYRGTARRNLYAIMNAVRTSLEGRTITATGAIFERPVWQSSEDNIAEDGVTYQGIQTFEVIVQPDI